MSAEVVEKKQRNFVYVPFDKMTCPVTGDVVGSVPGIKRRVLKKWGKEKYDSIEWPPLRTVEGLMKALGAMDDAQVNVIATHFGLSDTASLQEIAEKAVAAE